MNKTSAMENFEYIKETLLINPATNPHGFEECLKAMEKYKTPWWAKERDRRVQANWQIDEPVLLIPWQIFKKGVEDILGYTLEDKELSSDNGDMIIKFHERYDELMGK